jgi:nickel transport protein
MTLFSPRYLALALALTLLAAPIANAHATWIAERTGDYAVIHGEGASDEAYDPTKVTAAMAFNPAGAALEVALQPQPKNVILKPAEGAAVLSAVFDSGWWTEDATGEWHNARCSPRQSPPRF